MSGRRRGGGRADRGVWPGHRAADGEVDEATRHAAILRSPDVKSKQHLRSDSGYHVTRRRSLDGRLRDRTALTCTDKIQDNVTR